MAIGDKFKGRIKAWLDIDEVSIGQISVDQALGYEGHVIENRAWYRGDANELDAIYRNFKTQRNIDRLKFWGAASTAGIEIQKRHTGMPGLMIDTMTDVVLTDYNGMEFSKGKELEEIWNEISDDNSFDKLLKKALKSIMYVGDGAFKISIDTDITDYPIIEWWDGDKIEIKSRRGRLHEIIFKSEHTHAHRKYELHEIYGYGYIKYELYHDDKLVSIDSIPDFAALTEVSFGGIEADEEGNITKHAPYMMALHVKFGDSDRYDGRGQSVFDRKIDSFDSLDETWSQWMDALRSGRTKEYIPDNLIPKNPDNGAMLKPNPFDNRFIATAADISEGAQNRITTETPEIRHESYLSTYITALDLCLQGFISPSTLGIDVKKLDNAEAQREKEKTTLYTRQKLIDILEEDLPQIVSIALHAYANMNNMAAPEVDINLNFGEYANPSYESQIETVGKGRQTGVLSIEAAVDELYGDSKDDSWKKEEVKRIKEEQGIMEMEEPAVNLDGVDLNNETDDL